MKSDIVEALQRFAENPGHPGLDLQKWDRGGLWSIRASHRQRVLLVKKEGKWILQAFPDRSDSTIYRSE